LKKQFKNTILSLETYKSSCLISSIRALIYLTKPKATSQQISNWINMRNYPTIDNEFKLAKLLGVKVDDLYEEDEN
jgi:transcriptional regulator with XRE-family HTH domain